MESTNFITPNNYQIDFDSDEDREFLQSTALTVMKLDAALKENYRIIDNTEFQLTVMCFAIKAIGDIEHLLMINEDNPSLTANQRGLLSDLYRVACELPPHISFSLRLDMIRDEKNDALKTSMLPLAVNDPECAGYLSTATSAWANIFRNVNLLDILCVTKEIFGSRD